MSKKKLLEFGLKEADAFQKNFKIIFDRLVRGYKSMMGKDPEGLDLLKVKMEAREKALNTTKVVNQKGLTLDPDKPIVGGTQEGIETIKTKFDLKETQDAQLREEMKKLDDNMNFFQKELDDFNLSKDDPMGDLEKIVKGEGDTGLPKGQRPFGDNIRDAYREKGASREDASEMIEALKSPGAKQSYEIMEEALGVRLYGDETFEELMQIKETGVHPRGEPPLKKADGGKVPAAPSQLVSESNMILGYRGPGEYQGGRASREAADNRDRGRTEQYSRPSAPQDLGFIGGPTISPNLGKKGPDIKSYPTPDPRFSGYTPTVFDPGSQNIFQKGFDLVKRTVTNPFLQNVGLGILGGPIGAKFGLTRQVDMFNKARAIKGLFDRFDLIKDESMEDVLEEETGQTTALYKDGGLVTLFTEKR